MNSKMAGLVRCFTMMGAGALSLESVLIALLRITGRLLVPRVLCFAFEAYCLLTRFRDPSLFVNNTNEIVGSRWI